MAVTTKTRLKIIRKDGSDAHKCKMVLCRCQCKKIVRVRLCYVRSGRTKSCGCLQKDVTTERNKTHLMSKTKEYNAWIEMKRRIKRAEQPKYKCYAGIKICKRWEYSFENFFEDMGPSNGLTLDRIKSNGDYKPSNCRWATTKMQNRNTSRNKLITHNGKTLCVAEWCEELGYPAKMAKTICKRLHNGWPEEKALMEHVRGSNVNDN